MSIKLTPINLDNNQYFIKKRIDSNFQSDSNDVIKRTTSLYELYNRNTEKLVAKMHTTPSTREINGSKETSLSVDTLYVYDKNKGLGKSLLLLAEDESKHSGLEGRTHLIASVQHSKQNPPHLFYRKMGYKTDSMIFNLFMDLCLKLGLKLNSFLCKNRLMYK